jgi:hypothetical protein
LSLIDAFTPKLPQSQPFVRTRRVPSQPAAIAGKVYLGSDIGFVDYQGPKPRAGDLVHVTGSPGHYVATSGQAVPPITQPTFSPGACECKCASAAGVAFHLSSVRRTSCIVAVDVETGTVLQLFGLGDLMWGRGLGVDSKSPYSLYVLEDRRMLTANSGTITEPNTPREYFTVVKYVLSGSQYQRNSYAYLTDPSPDTLSSQSIALETNEANPPNFTRNGLSVFNDVAWLTMYTSPARILKIANATITTLNLIQNGDNYSKGLRGNVVSVSDKPAKATNFYVIAANSGNTEFELLQFNELGEISNILSLPSDPEPAQLASACNRLFVLLTDSKTFRPSSEQSA